jgi:hypothetical protein
MIRYFYLGPGFLRICLLGWRLIIVRRDQACFSNREYGHRFGDLLIEFRRYSMAGTVTPHFPDPNIWH